MSQLQFYQQVSQWRPLLEAREIRRLTRMAYEDWEVGGKKAHDEARVLGLGLDLMDHMVKVHRRLTWRLRSKR